MKKKHLDTKTAKKIAQVTEATIINWCRNYGIGIKVGGRWRISPTLLERMLQGTVEKGAEYEKANLSSER